MGCLSFWRAQVKLVTGGKPFVMFGDGRLAACKPISEADLAAYMADCIMDAGKADRVLPIGGAQAKPPAVVLLTWSRSHMHCGEHAQGSLHLWRG